MLGFRVKMIWPLHVRVNLPTIFRNSTTNQTSAYVTSEDFETVNVRMTAALSHGF